MTLDSDLGGPIPWCHSRTNSKKPFWNSREFVQLLLEDGLSVLVEYIQGALRTITRLVVWIGAADNILHVESRRPWSECRQNTEVTRELIGEETVGPEHPL